MVIFHSYVSLPEGNPCPHLECSSSHQLIGWVNDRHTEQSVIAKIIWYLRHYTPILGNPEPLNNAPKPRGGLRQTHLPQHTPCPYTVALPFFHQIITLVNQFVLKQFVLLRGISTINIDQHRSTVNFAIFPLVNSHITMERSTIFFHTFHGKIHYFDWAMFNSFLYVCQRVMSTFDL